jgi:hypothetical protein
VTAVLTTRLSWLRLTRSLFGLPNFSNHPTALVIVVTGSLVVKLVPLHISRHLLRDNVLYHTRNFQSGCNNKSTILPSFSHSSIHQLCRCILKHPAPVFQCSTLRRHYPIRPSSNPYKALPPLDMHNLLAFSRETDHKRFPIATSHFLNQPPLIHLLCSPFLR